MCELFDQGRWEEVEQRLRGTLAEDSNDARSAFRLANLLSLDGRYEEALRWYEVAWVQQWPGPVCLNNKAVALARFGEARAALTALRQALSEDRKYGPAAFNEAILLDLLGEEANVPGIVQELDLLAPGRSLRDQAQQVFEVAAAGHGWAGDRCAIDGPLYLWGEDLESGFGFEPKLTEADVEEGYRYYRDGCAHLEEGEWQKAVDSFELAVDLHADLESLIAPRRTQAQISLAREFRQKARDLRAAGNFDGARNAFDTFHRLAASLPDRALAEELLQSEIRDLGERLRRHEPSQEWRNLQILISDARQRVESLARRPSETPPASSAETPSPNPSEETSEPVEQADGEGDKPIDLEQQSGSEEKSGGEAEESTGEGRRSREEDGSANDPSVAPASLREYIQGLCRDAWGQQLRYLIAEGAFDEAELMLAFSEIQWFAQADLPRWRGDLYTAKAEALAAEATEELERGNRSEASALLGQAREAAMQTEDGHLTDRLDQQIARLERRPRPKKDFLAIDQMFGRGEYLEVLAKCSDMLRETPEEPSLRSRRESALHRLRTQVRGNIAARHWEQALDLTRAIQDILPDDEETQELAREARRGRMERLLSEAENALAAHRLEEAHERCQEALEIAPTDRRGLDLRRRIKVAKEVDPDAKDDAYDDAFVAFEKGRAAGKPEEAFEPLREMRALAPTTDTTQEATDWLVGAMVARYRWELEEERTPDRAGKLLSESQKLLDLVPDDDRVVRLQNDLRREQEGYGSERRRRSLDRLSEARKHLLDRQPVEALTVLQEVEEWGEPNLEGDLEEYQKEALGQIRRRIEFAIRQPVAERNEENGALNPQEVDRLLQVYSCWKPNQAGQLKQKREHRRAERGRRLKAREDLEDIEKAVGEVQDPLEALRTLIRRLLAKIREGSEILRYHRKELAALRQRLWTALSPFQKLRAWWFERYWQAARLFNEGNESEQDSDAKDQ